MLLSLTAAARELGCSVEHARRMIRSGRWPAYKIGPRAVRIDPEEIKALGRLTIQAEREKEKKM